MKDIIDFLKRFFKALYRTLLFWLKSKKAQTKETDRLIKQLSPLIKQLSPPDNFYHYWFKKYLHVKKAYKKVPTIQV